MPDPVAAIVDRFRIPGRYLDSIPYGSGHINDTYASRFDVDGTVVRYIHQRINSHVFPDPARLMDNIARVTTHLRHKIAKMAGDPDRETLTLIPTVDDTSFLLTDDGDFWRTYIFIEKARTVDIIEHNNQAYQAAQAFARFQRMLVDLPGERLFDSIPDFHHTPRRFAALDAAIAADSHDRVKECEPEIAIAMGRRDIVSIVIDAMAAGDVPERITHNDTKVNNVMLDDVDDHGVCVIDLDTVMPGSILYDFGDQVRSATGHFNESERDLSQVYIDLHRFEALVAGYLSEARAFLTPREFELLPFCGRLITFEIGIRFLTDFLNGDLYFKTSRPGQNLDRTRTQFRMMQSMEEHNNAMEDIVCRHREQ